MILSACTFVCACMYICVRVSGCAARARERVRGARAWVCVRVKVHILPICTFVCAVCVGVAATAGSHAGTHLDILQKVYVTRIHVLTRAVDRHGSRAPATNFHSHHALRCLKGPLTHVHLCARERVRGARARAGARRARVGVRARESTYSPDMYICVRCVCRGGCDRWVARGNSFGHITKSICDSHPCTDTRC